MRYIDYVLCCEKLYLESVSTITDSCAREYDHRLLQAQFRLAAPKKQHHKEGMTISRDDAIVECNAVGKLPKRRKPIGWQVADVCADHGFLQAGLQQVHKIGDLESLIVRAGELWGKLPAGSVGPPPSREEKEVASAVQLTSGLERWWLLQRLWELRRAQQRRRAQCLVRDVLSHPERRGWGHRFLPYPMGRVGGWILRERCH